MSHPTCNVCKNFFGAALLVALVSGCATPGVDLPPVPVGGPEVKPAPPPRRAEPWARRVPPPPPASEPAPSRPVRLDEEVLRLQLFLDRQHLSPGCLDGRWGPQTRHALRAWQAREGLPATGEWDEALRARLPPVDTAFTIHTVAAEDHAELRPAPQGWREKAQADRLGHVSVLELVAERYHCTQRAIRELNPEVAWPNPAAGAVVRVPRVATTARERAARVEIHLAGKYLQVFDAEGRLAAHFPCSIARQVEKRPVGELKIVNAADEPNYTFDPELFADDPAAAGIGRRLLIPPGPNNPVGVAWLSLDRPGYGIHGTPHPEDIGRTESHGCFRLANWNARKLLGMVSIGTPVLVLE